MIHLLNGLIRNTRARVAAGISLMILSLPAIAVPLLLEGPISAVSANPDGSGSITVLGVVVDIPAGITIVTPTATLSMAQVADPTPLPGRIQPGFIGGTAIINGTAVAGVNTADDMFLEPAENILGADITSIPPAPIEVGGVLMNAIMDARLPADPIANLYGFEVDPATVPTGGDATAEGYFSNDGSGVFQYFGLAVTGGDILNPGVTDVSITRAQCRAGVNPGDPINLRVLGGVHDPAVGTVTVKDYGPTTFGTVLTIADIPPFGLYTFKVVTDPSFTICPASVTVEYNGVTAVAKVAGGSSDVDGDGVRDEVDNCINVPNGPVIPDRGGFSQRDTDGDGYGNVCDADLNNDAGAVVNVFDLSAFKSVYRRVAPGVAPYGLADHADFNGDGVVNTFDLSIFKSMYRGTAGPSGLNP
jgi:hypothetical protein